MGVKDGGMAIKINGASDHIAEVRRIFQPTVKGIRIRTLEELIEQLDEANKIFKPNGFDCDYYVMKYMDSPCIVVHDSYQHDSDHARLLLALYLVQSPLNKIRCPLIQEARKL
ncbi:hypothetical protein WN943_018503 [Citrus x changshan-huyou]